MHVHRAALAHIIRAPHIIEQLVSGKGHAGMGQKQPQQFKLLEGQDHPLPCRSDSMTVQIHRHLTVRQLVGLPGRSAAPQHRLDTGDHFHHAEGLHQIVVGSHVQTLDLVILHPLGGGHDDRDIPGFRHLAQEPQQRHAVLAGQHHIQQHQFRLLRLQCRAERRAVSKAAGLKSCRVQGIYLDLTDAAVILHTPDHVNSSPL